MKAGIPCPEEVEPLGCLPRSGQMEEDSSNEKIFFEDNKSESGKKTYGILRFPASLRSSTFRRRFFSESTSAEWNNWRWQLANRITNLYQLERIIRLSDHERNGIASNRGFLPLAITCQGSGHR